MIPHLFEQLFAFRAETLILAILAFYALFLRYQLKKIRRVHSAMMSISAAPVQPSSIKEPEALSAFELLELETVGRTVVSADSPRTGLKLVETACPLDMRGARSEQCPLLRASRPGLAIRRAPGHAAAASA